MAFARMLRSMLRDPAIGQYVVPIIPDEGRTFGLDGLFSEVKIYSADGQRYTSVDAGLLFSYAEDQRGQILEEGITEAGAMASFQAAGTAYANWSTPMIPIFLFYSMFGFQRIGDMIWQSADARARGFLIGCTAGRTTMSGEGLQHEDGHSQLLASVVPSIRAFDPAFAYEVAFIMEDGLRAMYGPDAEDVVYYLTMYNENYPMPALSADAAERDRVREGVLAGAYRFLPGPKLKRGSGGAGRKATILFSGTAWQAATEASALLAEKWNVSAECWSVTSWKQLREGALEAERWNRLHPGGERRVPYVSQILSQAPGPVVAVTDYLKAVPDQISRFVPSRFIPLGTDGFGRSDTRASLRRHFEVDAAHVVLAVLAGLAENGEVKEDEVSKAIEELGIDPEVVDPLRA